MAAGDAIDSHTLILANIALGRPALDGLDQYDAYLDVRAVQEQFRVLDRDYPGSKFVFNTRNVDRWIVSRLNHLDGSYVTLMNFHYGVDLSWSEWVARWRRQFTDHENAINQHFGLRRDSDFLRFDVEADKPSVLAAFLDLENAADELPRENVTPSEHFGLSGGRIVAYTETSKAALERDEALVQRDAAVTQRDAAIAERDAAIAERDRLAAERVIVLAHRARLMEEASARKAAYEHLAAEVDRLVAQRDEIIADRGRIIAHGERLAAEVKAIAVRTRQA